MIVVFDHSARRRSVEVKGVGEVELPPYHQVPNSVLIAELFKVRAGLIEHVEAVLEFVPYGMRTGWEGAGCMKVTSFHFMPYRELPDDVELRYRSMWVDAPWHELADAARAGDFYNQSIDELMLAAEVGFDGLGTNEHHQNPYGFMCNPNLFGAILARMTRDRGLDTAIVQLGATLRLPRRRSASPRSTRCSTASAAVASSPASRSVSARTRGSATA